LRLRNLFHGVGWAAFTLTILWPTAALVVECTLRDQAPSEGFAFSARQLGLLWRSIWLASAATATCIVISLPGAFILGHRARLSDQPLVAAAMLATLLCPPMVLSFGWQRVLPKEFDPHLRCILVWSLWAWPIPAMLIAAGWSRVGRRAFEAALLATSAARAFGLAVSPLLIRHVAMSAMILFLLFFGDYGVPHANGLIVYATELLGCASQSNNAIDTLWPALLPITITAFALWGLVLISRRCAFDDDPADHALPSHSSRSGRILLTTCLVATWVPPMAALIVHLGPGDVFLKTLQTYGLNVLMTLGVAVSAALFVMVIAAGTQSAVRGRRFSLGISLLFGALPGAVVGESLIAAFNHPLTAAIYDHWPIVALAYAARFAWIGMLAAHLVASQMQSQSVDPAKLDIASYRSIFIRVLLPQHLSLLWSAAAAVTVLSVADVAASTLVRVPGFNPVAHVMIEKFHRFEDGVMISLSFILVGAALLGAMLLFVLQRRTAHR